MGLISGHSGISQDRINADVCSLIIVSNAFSPICRIEYSTWDIPNANFPI